MNANEFIKEATNLDVSGYPVDTKLSNIVGWDSLATVNMIVATEDSLDRELEHQELENLITIKDVGLLLDL